MSTFIVHKPRTRIVEKATSGTGVGVNEAVAAAAAQIEALRNDATVRIETIVARLGALRGAMATGTAVRPGEVRELADELAGLCGAFGLVEIGGIASSLCRLLDLPTPVVANHTAVVVHLDAVQMFARTEAPSRAEVAGGVLEGLRRIVNAHELRNGKG